MGLSTDVLVGLLTFLGIIYMAWVQQEVRQADVRASDAEILGVRADAVTQVTTSLLQAVEKLADRDRLIAELRARVEVLEEHDQRKNERIAELEIKVEHLEQERHRLIQERDTLAAEVAKLKRVTRME